MIQRPQLPITLACAALCLATIACQTTPRSPHSSSTTASWHKRLIEPVTAPTIFESPVIDTQLRPMDMIQSLPNGSIFGGGTVNVFAVQARYAVDDRLAIIATKDGYVNLDPDAGSSESGLADIAAGVKYAVIDDPDAGLLVTPGFIFEFASGDEDVFQGNGDGLARAFVSAGLDQHEWNLLGALGLNLPLDADEESTSIDWHAHVSYEMTESFVPLVEINGVTWIDSGNALAADFEGGDLINLGADDANGTVVTGAVGARYLVSDSLALGAAYEVPLSSREDLLDDRFTIDLVWRP